MLVFFLCEFFKTILWIKIRKIKLFWNLLILEFSNFIVPEGMHNNYWFSKDIRNKYSLDPDQVRILLEVFLENNFIFWQFSIKPECADFDVKEFCSA